MRSSVYAARFSTPRLAVAARQRHLLVAIPLGLVDHAVLLLEGAGNVAERVHHFERRMHVLEADAEHADARAVAIQALPATPVFTRALDGEAAAREHVVERRLVTTA